jgi:hypothetical protein
LSLDDSSSVITESIFWPPIPGKILQQAQALHEIISSPDGRDAYLKRLGDAGARPGQVVIRHTPAFYLGTFEAYAAYDVEGEGTSNEQHFDADAKEFFLVHESAAPSAPVDDPRSAGWDDSLSCQVLGSQWRLSAAKDPSVFVADNGAWTYRAPQVELEGTLALLQTGVISITDIRATGVEMCSADQVGAYRTLWRSECQELQLLVLDDACSGRQKMLHALALARVQ